MANRKWSGINYNAPNGELSSIDSNGGPVANSEQLVTFKLLKEAIVTARKDQYFMPLASVIGMPKHSGKAIKLYEYIPLLDDRNINDQGIDAAGATIEKSFSLVVGGGSTLTVGGNDNQGKAAAVIMTAKLTALNGASGTPFTDNTNGTITVAFGSTSEGDIVAPGSSNLHADADVDGLAELLSGLGYSAISTGSGNLYGSSKDIGTIENKLPELREEGGRVNRVGWTRIVREGSIQKLGFFTEFTQESLDFDTDEQLMRHISRELLNGAVQITEAILQRDLLAAAGVEYFTGDAVSMDTIGYDVSPLKDCVVTYEDLSRLDQILTDNRTPTQTKVITGSRFIDTRVIRGGRVAYVGSEVIPLLKVMKDPFGNPAFIGVQHYADAGTLLNGEIGSIDGFRFVQVPEMLHWAGAGDATGGDDHGYRSTGGQYDVYPILVVGDESFTTIGFQTNGKSVNFSIITKMPGNETAGYNDPYGERGFSSIKWYQGFLCKRPERIAVLYTLATV